MNRLLVVEDDADLRSTLHQALSRAGYAVDAVADGHAAEAALASQPYALMVLDLGLPGLDGLDVLRRLRSRGDPLPVLVLSARDALEQRVSGLRLGADDYLAKPFALQELEARLEALIRRAKGGVELLVNGPLQLRPGQQALLYGVPLDLPLRELKVLEVLMRRPGHVVHKMRLGQQLSGREGAISENAVEVYVHRLRRKLEEAGIAIRTVHRVGYVMEPHAGP